MRLSRDYIDFDKKAEKAWVHFDHIINKNRDFSTDSSRKSLKHPSHLILRSQNVISNIKGRGGHRYAPYGVKS